MDSVYIQNVLNGSTEDFRYLIRKYKDLAFSVAVSVVKSEFEAEEVVQEAFIKAYKNLASLKTTTNFKPWFYRILINEAFKRLKKLKGDIVIFNNQIYNEDEGFEDTFRGFNVDEQKFIVSESLKKVPSNECLLLRLFYLEGCSIGQMADFTGWSETNVKVILHRARKHLLVVVRLLMENEFTIEKA